MIVHQALKWPGGKAKLIPALRRHLPADRERLIAPFVGAGAFEFSSDYQELMIGDINPDLINFYRQLKRSGQAFIDYCAEWFGEHNTEADYGALRDLFNCTADRRLKAALFLYLNRHGYNGLCRYSASRNYNVPYGHHDNAPVLPREALQRLHDRLQGVTITLGDFEPLMAQAGGGDAVYADPPYLPVKKESFTAYSGTPFTSEDHQRLAKAARAAARRGAVVVVSNHNVWLAREIYREGKQHRVKVQRSIGASASSRGKVDELIVVYR
jgi:DNA adenine methylase